MPELVCYKTEFWDGTVIFWGLRSRRPYISWPLSNPQHGYIQCILVTVRCVSSERPEKKQSTSIYESNLSAIPTEGSQKQNHNNLLTCVMQVITPTCTHCQFFTKTVWHFYWYSIDSGACALMILCNLDPSLYTQV